MVPPINYYGHEMMGTVDDAVSVRMVLRDACVVTAATLKSRTRARQFRIPIAGNPRGGNFNAL